MLQLAFLALLALISAQEGPQGEFSQGPPPGINGPPLGINGPPQGLGGPPPDFGANSEAPSNLPQDAAFDGPPQIPRGPPPAGPQSFGPPPPGVGGGGGGGFFPFDAPFSPPAPDRNIGETCAFDGECRAAYSECAQNKCVCRAGFTASEDGRSCSSETRFCPYGDSSQAKCTLKRTCNGRDCNENPFPEPPVDETGPTTEFQEPGIAFNEDIQVRKKRMLGGGPFGPFAQPPPRIAFVDSCSDGEYCAVHNPSNGPIINAQGHCCKRPQLGCPIGEPLEKVTCGPGSSQFCPPSHYCSLLQDGVSPIPLTAKCCPKACPDTALFMNGTCYNIQLAGEKCELNEQCVRSNGKCVDGKCTCPKGTIAQNGVCVKVFCQGGPRLLAPELGADGDLVKCANKTQCGAESYCAKDHRICCPTPEPYCPPIGFGPSFSPRIGEKCAIQSSANQCGENEFCFQYFYSTDPKVGSVCCRQPQLPQGIAIGQEGPMMGHRPQVEI